MLKYMRHDATTEQKQGIANYLKRLRQDAGVNYSEAARRGKVASAAYWRKIEDGLSFPSPSSLENIALGFPSANLNEMFAIAGYLSKNDDSSQEHGLILLVSLLDKALDFVEADLSYKDEIGINRHRAEPESKIRYLEKYQKTTGRTLIKLEEMKSLISAIYRGELSKEASE